MNRNPFILYSIAHIGGGISFATHHEFGGLSAILTALPFAIAFAGVESKL